MISLETEIECRRLLKQGRAHREITRLMDINRGTVSIIAKLPGLRKRKRPLPPLNKLEKLQRCKTCGGMKKFQECLICWPRGGDYDNNRPGREDEQISFIWDVWELYKLNVIKHKLFVDLARRAKHILTKIRKNNAKKEKATK